MSNRTSQCDGAAPERGNLRLLQRLTRAAAAALVVAAPFSALPGTTDLSPVPLPTYTVGSTVDVKPNILMVLDDSGSMDWNYLPDWANLGGSYSANYSSPPPYLFNNASFNGVAYNPAVTYSPPVTFTSAGALDTTTYPSMTGTSTTTGGDSSATAASPNWNKVKNDGYSVQDKTGTSSLTGNAFFYTVIPGEYCDSPGLTNCTTSSTPTGNYQYAAMLRWCNSAALTTCKAQPDNTYTYPRITAPRVTTITFTNASSASVSGITVDGLQIMSGATSSSSTNGTVASRVATAINNCTSGLTGNCQIVGYLAFSSTSGSGSNPSGVVRIYAPGTTSGTPSVTTSSGTVTATVNGAFAAAKIPLPEYLSGSTTSSAAIPGDNVRTVITSSTNSYPYPGTSAKAATRTDCAGTTCTYKEEMTNYANWWAYYHTRMQMMKSATSRAFSTLDSSSDIAAGTTRYRVGYFSINNNTGSDFVNLADFDATGKFTWYSKILKAKPNNSTPLREALADAGRLYAGVLNGTQYNSVTVTEPLQFACQRNYTILSTDGFWNGNAGYKLDGSTMVGNQDGPLPRPYNDGAVAQVQQRTSQLQTRTDTQVAQKGTLQSQTSQLQTRTSQLQQQTLGVQQQTQVVQQQTQAVQQQTQAVQQQTSQLQKRTSSDSGNTWTAWADASSCTVDNSGSSRTQCQYASWTSWTTVSSCTIANQSSASPYTVGTASKCQYTGTWSSWATVSSCTIANLATGTTNGTVYPTGSKCQYTGSWSSLAPVASCTIANLATGTTNGTVYPTGSKCQYTGSWSSWAPVASCTIANLATGTTNGTVYPTGSNCQYNSSWSAWNNVSSCTTVSKATSTTNGTAYPTASNCQYTSWTSWAATPSCTAVAQSTSSPYSGPATQCQTVVTSAYANASSCSPNSAPDANGYTTQCQYSFAASAGTPTCSPAYSATDFSNPTVYKGCTNQAGASWTNVSSCTITSPAANGQFQNCRYAAWSSWSNVSSCTPTPQSTGPSYTVGKATDCQSTFTGGTSDTLADVAAYYYNTDLRNASQSAPDATGSCTAADGSTDLCANNVIPYGRDTATWQHMTLHTLGLGAQGMMVFSPYQNNLAGQKVYVPDYWSQPSGDFYSVANGSTASSSVCTWMSSGSTCTWSTPASDSIANIDDLWHAAVNGHGSYFSATDPSSLSSALSAVLAQIVNTPRPGTAAAAASSNPNITSSDNYVFSSSYQSVNWFGELIMQRFNADGTLTDQQWSAMQLLDCATTPWQANFTYSSGQVFNQGGSCYLVNNAYTSGGSFASGTGADGANTTALTGSPVTRTIYMAGTSGLTPFTWSNLTSAQQAYFSTPYLTYVSASQGLSQFCAAGSSCLSSTAQTAASGQALVNYLRGDRTNEGTYFRSRMHTLGDIVSSEARYVKQPLQTYLDTNYSAFVSAQSTRPPTVYVGANDGMLHAFDALSGQERWAYIPTAVLPNLYKLADMNYANQHQYFVDGTPEVGDICPNAPASTCSASQWRTIIVGGLNEGGKTYYALDITDPSNPSLLWEFSNANLGSSYSDPRITKLADGTWVVILASGYNNADGIGRLYVLNAATGALINTISTGVGSASNPSGLAKIAARSSTGSTNNTVDEVYGGDLLGNVWRFDVNGTIGAAGTDAQLLINLQGPTGTAQPITTKPVAASVNNVPVVMIGTGRYLGLTDLTDTSTYSMYAIKDSLGATTMTTPRASGSKFVQQTLTATTCPTGASSSICNQGQSVLTASSNAVDWSLDNGWYIDFVNPGERSVTDASLALGTLVFTTIKPQTSTTGTITGCTGADTSVNAQSFLYFLDYTTGGAVSGTQGVVGELLCTCVATRPSVVKTQSGTVEGIIRMSGGGVSTGTDMGVTSRQDLPYNSTGGALRRTSWRELNGD